MSSKAFEFGKTFLDLVRSWRMRRRNGDPVKQIDLANQIQVHTGLDPQRSLRLTQKVINSDNNAGALCEVYGEPLSLKELEACVDAPNFRRAILQRNL